ETGFEEVASFLKARRISKSQMAERDDPNLLELVEASAEDIAQTSHAISLRTVAPALPEDQTLTAQPRLEDEHNTMKSPVDIAPSQVAFALI
ncbi:hypothetical protein, partial [Escherichia coli]|uniref:hypothetical protein n=1 Tax=Escherichia coli TaxID=562 RepID=UPI0013D416F9